MTHSLIYIEWCDATTISGEWEPADHIIKWAETEGSWLVREVGFVLTETDEYLLIVSQITDSGNVGAGMKIPKTWVRKRVELSNAVE